MNPEIIKALAVTAELTGTELSLDAARVFAEDLSRYPVAQVLGALVRCRREVRNRLTLSDVISRLDDGRPGAEEAWSMMPKTERDSVVWTDEMSHAFSVAQPLLDEGDAVAARMAFKEAYTVAVQSARDVGAPPKWWPSYGQDKSGRAVAVRQAAERKRIPAERAMQMLTLIGPQYAEEHHAALTGPQHVAALLPSFERKGNAA